MHTLDPEGFRRELVRGANDAFKGFLPELSDHIRRDVRIELQQARNEFQQGMPCFISEASCSQSMHVVVDPPSPASPSNPWVHPQRPPPRLAPLNKSGSSVNGKLDPDYAHSAAPSILKALGASSASSSKFKRSHTNHSMISGVSASSRNAGNKGGISHEWTQHYPRSQLVTQALHMYPMQSEPHEAPPRHSPKPSPRPSPKGTPEPLEDEGEIIVSKADMARQVSDSSSDRWASATPTTPTTPREVAQGKDFTRESSVGARASLAKDRTFLAPLQTGGIRKFSSKRGVARAKLVHMSTAFHEATSYVLKWRRRLFYVVTSSGFDYIVGFLLVLNAISNGLQVDHMARNKEVHAPFFFRLIEMVFCVVFVIELTLRIIVHGKAFFVGPGWQWNWFDAVLVFLQLLDELMSAIVDAIFGDLYASEYTNFAFVRILRLLRLVRVLRFVRILRLVRELHVMVCSIAGSLRTFLWTCALFALMIYVVGVYFTQLVVDHSRANPETYTMEPELQKYFGSLGHSVLSLFQATSGGIDWNDLLDSLNPISPIMAFVLSAYIAFATLVMLNLVTGIFVDSARINIVEYKDLDLVNRVRELFVTSDENRTGFITWEEFERQLRNPQMEAYFKVLDLDLSEAQGLFYLLDVHNSGEISSEEFVNGCLGLRGTAKALDMKTLMFNSKRMFQLLVESTQRIEDSIESFTSALERFEEFRVPTCSDINTVTNIC